MSGTIRRSAGHGSPSGAKCGCSMERLLCALQSAPAACAARGLPGEWSDAIMTELVQVSEKLLKTAGRGEERGRMPGLEIYHLGGGLSL